MKTLLFILLIFSQTFSQAYEKENAAKGVAVDSIQKNFLQEVSSNNQSKQNKQKEISKSDLNNTIQLLESEEKRQVFLKTLKILAGQEKENQNESGVVQVTEWVISKIEQTVRLLSQALVQLFSLPIDLFQFAKNTLSAGDFAKYKPSFFLLSIILSAAFLIEYCGKFLVKKFFNPLGRVRKTTRRMITNWIVDDWLGVLLFSISLYSFYLQLISIPSFTKVSSFSIYLHGIVIVRNVLSFSRLFFLPKFRSPLLRLPFNTYRLYRQVFETCTIVLVGIFTSLLLKIFSFPPSPLNTWNNLIGLLAALSFLKMILSYRYAMVKWLSSQIKPQKQKNNHQFTTKVMGFLIQISYVPLVVLVIATYIAWGFDAKESVIFILTSSLQTFLALGIFYFANQRIAGFVSTWLRPTGGRKLKQSKQGFMPIQLLQSTYFLVPIVHFFLYFSLLLITLWIWGINWISLFNSPSFQSKITSAIAIFIIIVTAKVLWSAVDLVIHYQLNPSKTSGDMPEVSIFVKTIAPIAKTIARWLIVIIAALLILKELDRDILPLIYGFSVIGLAISLGAQGIVKDIINGILTLMEGNLAVGDYVILGQHTGLVERITLRSIFLRHSSGALQTIPFSEVSSIINKSKDFSVCQITLPLSYAAPIPEVLKHVHNVYDEMKKSEFKSLILTEPRISGIERFGDLTLNLSVSITTKPDPKNTFGQKFNEKIYERLRESTYLTPVQFQSNIDYKAKEYA